jgi:hypothetical protein
LLNTGVTAVTWLTAQKKTTAQAPPAAASRRFTAS